MSIIVDELTAASSCSAPLYASYKLDSLTGRTPMSSNVSNDPAQLMVIRKNDLTVGQAVSMDQYNSTTFGVYLLIRNRQL